MPKQVTTWVDKFGKHYETEAAAQRGEANEALMRKLTDLLPDYPMSKHETAYWLFKNIDALRAAIS